MKQKFSNAASTTLASGINDAALTLTATASSLFATLAADEFELTTLDDGENFEVIKVTARSGNTWTIARAQEGTTARSWLAGAKIEARATKGTYEQFIQKGGDPTGAGSAIIQGKNNAVTGNSSAADAGENNTITADYSVALGGHDNAASEYAAWTLGGDNNTASGYCSGVAGGEYCTVYGEYATVIGGNQCEVTGKSIILGGNGCNITGNHSSSIGGKYNDITGNGSATAGGIGIYVVGDYSFACGAYSLVHADVQSSFGTMGFAANEGVGVMGQESTLFRSAYTTDDTATSINIPYYQGTPGMPGFTVGGINIDGIWRFNIMLVARQMGGTEGSVGDVCVYEMSGVLKNTGGTLSFVGGTPSFSTIASDAGSAAWSGAFDISANTFDIKGTGEADKNIIWIAKIYLVQLMVPVPS